MGVFERIKKAKRSDIREVETCVMDERMWNIFNRIPWRVYYGKDPVLAWVALNSWEEEYLQFAYLNAATSGVPTPTCRRHRRPRISLQIMESSAL